ncbi:MAG: hypothetical protein NTZ67_02955 [Gammaproteobacteria bacterium]|nr:hypothetical protein [Gammaproteobacteria bacterium]
MIQNLEDPMVNEAQTAHAKKADSELAIKTISVLASIFADAYYWVTTQNAAWYNISSGLGANLFVNTFAAYNSAKHLKTLKNNIANANDAEKIKNTLYFVSTLAVALLWSLPYGFIAYHESTDENKGGKLFEAVASVIGGFVINGLALKSLSDEFDGLKKYCATKSIEQKNSIENMKTLMQLHDVIDYSTVSPEEVKMLQERDDSELKVLLGLNLIFNHSHLAPKPTFINMPIALNWLVWAFNTFVVKLAFEALPLYSALAVACATDVSLQKDPPFKMSSALGVSFGNFFMLGEDFLSVVGGYYVASSLIDFTSNLIKYRKVSNNVSALTALSAAIALIVTCFSGFTAEKQQGQCENSLMNYFMMFAYANIIANISSGFFNFIYAEKCVSKIINHFKKTEKTACEIIGDAISAGGDLLAPKSSGLAVGALESNNILQTLQQNPAQFNIALFSNRNKSTSEDDTGSLITFDRPNTQKYGAI